MIDYTAIGTFIAIVGGASAIVATSARQTELVSAQITKADENAQARADALVAAARETIDQAAITAQAAITQSALVAQRAVDKVATVTAREATAQMTAAAQEASLRVNEAAIEARKIVTDAQEALDAKIDQHTAEDAKQFADIRRLIGALVGGQAEPPSV